MYTYFDFRTNCDKTCVKNSNGEIYHNVQTCHLNDKTSKIQTTANAIGHVIVMIMYYNVRLTMNVLDLINWMTFMMSIKVMCALSMLAVAYNSMALLFVILNVATFVAYNKFFNSYVFKMTEDDYNKKFFNRVIFKIMRLFSFKLCVLGLNKLIRRDYYKKFNSCGIIKTCCNYESATIDSKNRKDILKPYNNKVEGCVITKDLYSNDSGYVDPKNDSLMITCNASDYSCPTPDNKMWTP